MDKFRNLGTTQTVPGESRIGQILVSRNGTVPVKYWDGQISQSRENTERDSPGMGKFLNFGTTRNGTLPGWVNFWIPRQLGTGQSWDGQISDSQTTRNGGVPGQSRDAEILEFRDSSERKSPVTCFESRMFTCKCLWAICRMFEYWVQRFLFNYTKKLQNLSKMFKFLTQT
jgi:hypothetical protein